MQRLFLGMYFAESVANVASPINGAIQPAFAPLERPSNAQDETDEPNVIQQPDMHEFVNIDCLPPEAAADANDEEDLAVGMDPTINADKQHGNQQEILIRPVFRKRIRRELPPPRDRVLQRVSKQPQRFFFERLQCLTCLRFFQRCDLPNGVVRAIYCSAICFVNTTE